MLARMKVTRKPKQRPKPIDLDRKAAALGVTPGHLSMVISGKRYSKSLLTRYDKLAESENSEQNSTPKTL